MSILEIETAITKLSPAEVKQLLSWLEERYADIWDRQITEDLDSGRLDAIISEAEKEYQAGLGRPL